MGLLFNCVNTFYTTIPACWQVITANLNLPQVPMEYRLKTPNGKIYRKEVIAGEGEFELLASDFPPGLFNPWAGQFVMQFFEPNGCNPLEFNICQTGYDTLVINVAETDGEAEELFLVCQCEQDA